jgi:protein tyrosine/serine phosphatase
MKFFPRRTALRVLLALAAIPAAILIFQAGLSETGNFHEVIAGELYRSAQPSAGSLRHEAEQYGIRTVINLRGAHPGVGWYDDEKRTAEAMGLRLIDFPMSASRELTHGQAAKLVATLRDAEKPILLHCNTGADRTGLVSIIYANQIAGIDEETAEEQLSPLFGHFGIPLFSPTFAMDESWEDLESFFGIVGS